MNVPFHRHTLSASDKAAVMAALDSDHLTQGPQVRAFEAALAEYTGAKFAVCVSSGSAALYCAYVASGLRRVSVPANTFVATRNAALVAGLEVDVMDVNPATGMMDSSHVAGHRTPCETGVVPVDFAGDSCNITHVGHLCIRDAAHSLELYHHCPDTLPGVSEAVCFSFHPCKAVTTAEGGAVITNDENIALKCEALRDNGRVRNGPPIYIDGCMNLRMNELSAALGVSQLKTVGDRLEQRRTIAARYDAAFGDIGYHHPEHSACHLYPIRTDGETAEEEYIVNTIQTRRHYPPLADLPGAREWYDTHVSLPLFPSMTDAEVGHVIETVKRVEGL